MRSPWESAWREALYGADGFYRRAEGPAGHFRTAAHAAPAELAVALARLARAHGRARIVDVGAGRGELLGALAGSGDNTDLLLHGVDIVERPTALAPEIGWSAGLDALPDDALDGALVIAWELLDVVPCPIIELDDDGRPCVVQVEAATGGESLDGPPDPGDAEWLARWWPLDGAPPGARAEVGAPRDALWAGLVQRCAATTGGAVLLAVDYAHTLGDRPQLGSLAAFRRGRAVPPVPDGSCDLSAHVALDAVAAAGERAGASSTQLTTQRAALMELGLAGRATSTAELLDPGGLGAFSWLLQSAGPQTSVVRLA